MHFWTRVLTHSVLAIGFAAAPTLASGGSSRSGLDDLRAQIMRLHVRLQYEANNAPEVLSAHKAACVAYTEMYKRRAEVLTRLHQTSEYQDLRLALYHTQRKLAGVHEEIPVRIQRIMETATDALAIRIEITRLEARGLEADAEYVQVRDTANALNAAYRQALRESLATVRTNPQLLSLVDQLSASQSAYTGMRPSRVASGG